MHVVINVNPYLMHRSRPHEVVVAVIEATSTDLDVFVSFRRQRVGAPECVKLRMVYPEPSIPVFKFTGEFLDFNF